MGGGGPVAWPAHFPTFPCLLGAQMSAFRDFKGGHMRKPMRLAVALSLLVLGSARAADTVKIGLMAPLTGSWASEGQEMKRNVELLAAEQNARGRAARQADRGRDRGRRRRPAHRGARRPAAHHQGRGGRDRHLRLGRDRGHPDHPRRGRDHPGGERLHRRAAHREEAQVLLPDLPARRRAGAGRRRDAREDRRQEDRDPPRQLGLLEGAGRRDRRDPQGGRRPTSSSSTR